MTVGTFQQPDFETQSGTEYKTAIDNAIQALTRMAAAFAPHEQSTPDMTVRVDAGAVFQNADDSLTEKAAQNSATMVAPAANPRIDRVVIDALTGVVSVITGAEAASPSPPAITTGKLPICQILLQTTSTEITNDMITDERALQLLGITFPDPPTPVMTLKETQSPSAAASATFTSLDKTKHYVLKMRLVLSAACNFSLRFNADTGNNYEWSARCNGTAETLAHGGSTDQIRLNALAAYNNFAYVVANFAARPADTTVVDVEARCSFTDNTGSGELMNGDAVGKYDGASDLTSLTILVSAGNFTGKISLYEISD